MSKFDVIYEETLYRFQTGGLMEGDYVKLIKNYTKNPKIKDKAQGYFDKLDYITKCGLPIKLSVIKAERAESTNGLVGSPDAPTSHWADILTEYAPGLWANVITVPLEILEKVEPEGNNWSPSIPKNITKSDPTTLKPNAVKQADPNRNLPEKNTDIA